MSFEDWVTDFLAKDSTYYRGSNNTIYKKGFPFDSPVSTADLQHMYGAVQGQSFSSFANNDKTTLAALGKGPRKPDDIAAAKRMGLAGASTAQLGKFALQDVASIGASSLKTNNFDPDRPGFLMPSTFFPSIKTANTSGMSGSGFNPSQQSLRIGKG